MTDLRPLAPLVGQRFAMGTSKAWRVLGVTTRPAEATFVDCARSLTALGR